MGDGKASGDRKEPSGSEEGNGAQRSRAETKGDPSGERPAPSGDNAVQSHQNSDDDGDKSQGKGRRYFGEIKGAEGCMIVFTAITAMATWAGVIIADYQWKLGKRQINFAERQFAWAKQQQKSADASTQQALSVARATARAARDEAVAMKQMAGATDKQATAATDQAKVVGKQLALSQMPNIDLDIQPWPYQDFGPFGAMATITNSGYPVRVAVYARSELLSPKDIPSIWNRLKYVRTIYVVSGPNGAHHQPFGIPHKIDPEREWFDLVSGDKFVVQAMRLIFYDAGGGRHRLDQCIAYGGPPPGQVFDRDCQDREPKPKRKA